MDKYQLVKVVWRDAFAGETEWTALKTYHPEEVLPITVGWLIPNVLDGYVTTADTYYVDSDGDVIVYNIGHIPEDMVVSMEIIKNNDKIKKTSTRKAK